MKGLEISRKYYEEYGLPMLKEQFPEVMNLLAVGLVGSGSECFGFDDEVSRDHDFDPGFCIFLPDESVVDRRTEFQLERAYAKLPAEFMGVRRQKVNPAGGNRRGVMRTGDFYESKIGSKNGLESFSQWFSIPESYLAEAVNGEVFYDGHGEFSAIREEISHMPPDVMKKKLAGQLFRMSQSGQYNYDRCLAHGETGAAQLALFEFCDAAIACAYLLSGVYRPYYKWCFKGLSMLPRFTELASSLEFLLTNPNDENMAFAKNHVIGECAETVIAALKEDGLTDAVCTDLQKHAFSVNDRVSDNVIRNADILFALS